MDMGARAVPRLRHLKVSPIHYKLTPVISWLFWIRSTDKKWMIKNTYIVLSMFTRVQQTFPLHIKDRLELFFTIIYFCFYHSTKKKDVNMIMLSDFRFNINITIISWVQNFCIFNCSFPIPIPYGASNKIF